MEKGADQQMTSTIHKNGITENCESDSGVSLDRSPKGIRYNFLFTPLASAAS